MIENRVSVGIGEYKIAKPPAMLKTIVGSCVGVIIYDKVHKVGGLAHVYLPAGTEKKEQEPAPEKERLKFADLLIPALIREILENNGKKKNLTAYLIGGAALFSASRVNSLNIGERNLNSVRDLLDREGIDFLELQVGGSKGRSVIFDLSSGDITIKELSPIKGEDGK